MRIRALLVCSLAAVSLFADDLADSRRHQQAAMAAYKEKNAAAFLENIRKASDLRPQHPTLLYQLAGALDANGRHAEAIGVLERVAAMGFVYDAASDFKDPRYAKVIARFAENRKAIGTAKQEIAIDRLGLIPEGMAWDGQRFLVSSVRTKTIFRIENGKAVPFATAPWGVFGMAADPRRGVLWAATAAMPQVEGYQAADKGKTAILKIGLWTGRILETLTTTDAGEHSFGDVAVAADGEVYASDSRSPVIYRVTGSTLEPFVRGPFASLQGLAPSGSLLYAADYSKGLFVIDRRTGDVHAMRVPPEASLLGVDGLYLAADRTLVATQNGTNPNRVVRIALAPGGLAVSAVDVLLANRAPMRDPTLGVMAGKRFYFNANAQWELFGDDGGIADPLKLEEALVLSVPVR